MQAARPFALAPSASRPLPAALAEVALKTAKCALFPVIILAALAALRHVEHRYDLMLAVCLAAQVWMVRAGLETKGEAVVITIFHLLGLAMELHKVHVGAWIYPGVAFTKFGGVPLYSG